MSLKTLWDSSGTKILGILITILGVLVGLDATTQLELFGSAAQAVMTTAAGLLTILRGFVNTANIKATMATGGTPT